MARISISKTSVAFGGIPVVAEEDEEDEIEKLCDTHTRDDTYTE
jgi:hypothetical protein